MTDARIATIEECQAFLRHLAEQVLERASRTIPRGLQEVAERQHRHYHQAADLLNQLKTNVFTHGDRQGGTAA